MCLYLDSLLEPREGLLPLALEVHHERPLEVEQHGDIGEQRLRECGMVRNRGLNEQLANLHCGARGHTRTHLRELT